MASKANNPTKMPESGTAKKNTDDTDADCDDDNNPLIAMWKANGKPNPFITYGAKNKQEEEEMMAAAKARKEEAKKKYANMKPEDMVTIRQVFGNEYERAQFKAEFGEDIPHWGDAPAKIPEGWKVGDPPLGLKKALEVAPLEPQCCVQ